MKILLYSRPGTGHDPRDVENLLHALHNSGIPFKINEGFAADVRLLCGVDVPSGNIYSSFAAESLPGDVMLSYGGDGTFLECTKMVLGTQIPILGINSGRLGFLANVAKEDVGRALEAVGWGLYRIEKSPLLEIEGTCRGIQYAFNELSIQRGSIGMIAVETYINQEMVATYWGDGAILATPAGSTAYALSVGGPVVAPECGCFVLAPIAPHNLTMRPVVLPDSSKVEFKVMSRGEDIAVSVDGDHCMVPDGSVLRAVRSKKSVFLIRLQNISFYDTLRNKMLWGLDKRDETVPSDTRD